MDIDVINEKIYRITKNFINIENIKLSPDTVIWNGFTKLSLNEHILSDLHFSYRDEIYISVGYPDPYYLDSRGIYCIDCLKINDISIYGYYCWEDEFGFCYLCTFPRYTLYWNKVKVDVPTTSRSSIAKEETDSLNENFEGYGDYLFGIRNIKKVYSKKIDGVFRNELNYTLYIHKTEKIKQ